MRRAVAKDPKAGFVIEVWLAVDPVEAPLRLIRQPEVVFLRHLFYAQKYFPVEVGVILLKLIAFLANTISIEIGISLWIPL